MYDVLNIINEGISLNHQLHPVSSNSHVMLSVQYVIVGVDNLASIVHILIILQVVYHMH